MKKYLWLILFLCSSLAAQTYLSPLRDAYKLRVSKGYDSTATTVVLSTGQGAYLPTANFDLVWYNASAYFHPFDDPSNEWIHVGTRSGDTLKSVTRGVMRTAKKNHNLAGYTYRVMPVISENMWLKVDTAITNIGGYSRPTRAELGDTLNMGANTMTTEWDFNSQVNFNSGVYLATGTNIVVYVNGSGYASGVSIPTTAKLLGGGSLNVPTFYNIVGAGGATVTVSNDTIYITAGTGGAAEDSVIHSIVSDTSKYLVNYIVPHGKVVKAINGVLDSLYIAGLGGAIVSVSNDTIYINAGVGGGGTGIQGIQNTNSTLDITNPTGPTATINIKSGYKPSTAGTADNSTNATYATNAGNATTATYATSAGSATTATSAATATTATSATSATTAGYATTAGTATSATNANYATTAGGAPPTGTATGGMITGTFPNGLTVAAGTVTSTMILNSTIGTTDLSGTCKSPLAGYADSIVNQSSLFANKLDLARRAKFSLTGQAFFYDSLRLIAGTYISIIQSGNTLTINSTGGAGGVGPYTGLGTSFWSDDSTFKEGQASTPKNGYFAMYDGSGDLQGSDYTPEILSDSFRVAGPSGADLAARLPGSGVTAGTHTNSTITVDSTGRITYAATGTGGASSGYWYKDTIASGKYFDTLYIPGITNQNVVLAIPRLARGIMPADSNRIGVFICPTDTIIISRNVNTAALAYNVTIQISTPLPIDTTTPSYGFDPTTLASAQTRLWIDPEYQTAINDSVLTYIPDLSGRNNNLTAHKVRYRTSGVNGKPYYSFGGRLDTSVATSTASDLIDFITSIGDSHTVITVVKMDSVGPYNTTQLYCTIAGWYGIMTGTPWTTNGVSIGVRWSTSSLTGYYVYTPTGCDADSAMDSTFTRQANAYMTQNQDSTNFRDSINIYWAQFHNYLPTGDRTQLYLNSTTPLIDYLTEIDRFPMVTKFAVGSYNTGYTNYNAGMQLYALYIFKGILSPTDRNWLLQKIDAKWGTPYVP